MPEDVLEKEPQHEAEETPEQELSEFKPGELCAVDATNDRVDLDEDDGSGFTTEEKEGILKSLASKVAQRDLTSRRLQVRDAWKARYFYRGNQYLLPGKNGAWVLPQMVLVGGQSYDDHNSETNIYLAFGDTITASLTAGLPSVRFEPDDPTNPSDTAAAENSETARRLIERANNMIVVQEDISRFLWTDGLSCVYTRYVIDGQRFGYAHESDLDDELSYLPELGGEGPDKGGEPTDRGEPRGQEVIEAFGTLEVKLPIQANNIAGSSFLQFSREHDITLMKTKYPEHSKDIQPMQTPTAETEYERLARTSIMMGMRPSNMTNDAMTYNATEQLTWVRPSFFHEEKDDNKRNWLFDNFSKGAMIAMVGTTLCEVRNESLDDHWTLIHARPGDGAHRPALGSPVIPLQEKLNDCMDLVHQSFMHLIPIKWVDSEAIDTKALTEIQAKPNQYLKMKRRADKDMAGNMFIEPQLQIAEGLLIYLEKLFGEFAQFLCGAFPALFGGNTGSNDTASGIASQRDQALGRIGLSWRNIRAGYASIIRQAVQCAAEFRNSPMSGEVPGAGGIKERLSVDPNDLKGNIRCYPDTDENFPESWVAQRAVWTQMLQAAATNPVLQAILTVPRNMMIAKDKTGLPELVVPSAAAAAKQAGEIILLLQASPIPNPAIDAAKAQFMQTAAQHGPPPPEIAAQLQQALPKVPPQISTVKIGTLDNHQFHMAEIQTWSESPEGIRAQAENNDGYENVMLHYDEHAAALEAAQAGKGEPPAKPVSEGLSVNFKDLPPEGQVQAAAKVGIQLDLSKLQAEDTQDKMAEAAKALKPAPALPVQ